MADRLVGQFEVRTDRACLAKAHALAALSGDQDTDDGRPLPAILPMVWLDRAEVRDALASYVPANGALVHQAQDIIYEMPLLPNKNYTMSVVLSGPDKKGGVTLRTHVHDADQIAVSATTKLVLFSVGEAV